MLLKRLDPIIIKKIYLVSNYIYNLFKLVYFIIYKNKFLFWNHKFKNKYM